MCSVGRTAIGCCRATLRQNDPLHWAEQRVPRQVAAHATAESLLGREKSERALGVTHFAYSLAVVCGTGERSEQTGASGMCSVGLTLIG